MFYDMPLVLLDCNALLFQTWKFNEHMDLVVHKNMSKGLGVLQSWKTYTEEREPQFATIGTWCLGVPISLALRDWYLSSPAMCWVLHATNMYSFLLPLTQRLMSSWQIQNFYSILLVVWNSFFNPLYMRAGVPMFAIAQSSYIGLHHPSSFDKVGWQSCNKPMGRKIVRLWH